jgi:hypothetical protein
MYLNSSIDTNGRRRVTFSGDNTCKYQEIINNLRTYIQLLDEEKLNGVEMYVNCHADAAFSEQKQQRTMSIKKHSRKQRASKLFCVA